MLQAWIENRGWLHVICIFYPRAVVILSVSEGIFYVYIFIYTLLASGVLDFLRRALHLRVCGRRQFPTRMPNTLVDGGSIYIIIHRQTLSLYHKYSVWLDTRDASRWDQNPADFTSLGYLTPDLSLFTKRRNFLRIWIFIYTLYIYICIYIYIYIYMTCKRIISWHYYFETSKSSFV